MQSEKHVCELSHTRISLFVTVSDLRVTNCQHEQSAKGTDLRQGTRCSLHNAATTGALCLLILRCRAPGTQAVPDTVQMRVLDEQIAVVGNAAILT